MDARAAVPVRSQGWSSQDGGIWRGPTDAAWMKRILHGALAPRGSTGTALDGLVPHG
jgi:hypothetical protein